MGGGSWTSKSFRDYSRLSKNCTLDSMGTLNYTGTAQELFKSKRIQPELDPYDVIRECCDSEEHPNSVPVLLFLDVTGSMGPTAVEVAKQLNVIMTKLYDKVTDVEFLVGGIGDLAYDAAPLQVSQFESDVRIAEQLDKIWFEAGGGGNGFESYTAAWYFGLKHCKLDCWNRGKKGIIITMGDEPLNPYLPKRQLATVTGDSLEADVETDKLYEMASKKFDIYHIGIEDRRNSFRWYGEDIMKFFGKYLDKDHLRIATLNSLPGVIVDIIEKSVKSDNVASFIDANENTSETNQANAENAINW